MKTFLVILWVAVAFSCGPIKPSQAAENVIIRDGSTVAIKLDCMAVDFNELNALIPDGRTTFLQLLTLLVNNIRQLSPQEQALCFGTGEIAYTLIPQNTLAIHGFDSEETERINRLAINAIDGDPNTFWHTEWTSGNGPHHPHHIDIDLGALVNIGKMTYLPRTGNNGRVKDYEVFLSQDGTNWGSPVASGQFPDDEAEHEVTFQITSARYVRLKASSAHDGLRYTSVNELNFYTATQTGPAIVEKAWRVHDNGQPTRPAYVTDATMSVLIKHETARAQIGELCAEFVKQVGTTRLEYRRLLRDPTLIAICEYK